ncbi:MAG: hypothetical protein FWF57_04065 [Defluviitaleaceae bacterium]|nr:hypothetical protein [Defluviitaleaceae bacterium]
MTFIKNTLKMTRSELYYQWSSKKIILIIAILLGFAVIHLLGLYNNVLSAYNLYRFSEARHIEEGRDIIEVLSEPMYEFVHENTRIISNTLRYDFISLSSSIQNLSPQNAMSNFLEFVVFAICTVIFGIYAAYIAFYEYRLKIHKITSVKYSQLIIILGRLLSIAIVVILSIAISLLFIGLGSIFVRNLLYEQIPINNFTLDILGYSFGLPPQLLLSFGVLFFYVIIGFSISYIFKSIIIPTIVLFLYGFIIPILGAYDFRNIFSYFAHNVFSFESRFIMFRPHQINEYYGIAIIIFTVFFLFLTMLYISNKRSLYD